MKDFYTIFLDNNNWNEKTIIGFMSFAIMCVFAFADLGTSLCCDKDLVISDTIYNSFVYITIGCLGIDGLQKFAGNKKKEDPKKEDEEII
jgi:hypothetical protein